MTEEWRDIAGYEGKYMVSNTGKVKSLNYKRTGKERILKAGNSTNGYLQVTLWKDGKEKTYKIHRLVACAFIPNPHGYNEINHMDECKSNNFIENLEWCSRSYNNTYNGRAKKIGKKNTNDPNRSKSVIGVDRVTGLIVEFASVHEASRQIGIDPSNLCACLKGRRKSAKGYYWFYASDSEEEVNE